MLDGLQALTEKEKETLRLMGRGHDAKSMARHLGLSVHTVNERLRDARRKMDVSSSRAAARMLLDTENPTPDFHADTQIGEAATARDAEGIAESDALPRTRNGLAWGVTGVAIMSLLLGILGLSALTTAPSAEAVNAAPSAAAAPTRAAETDATRAARAWLELGDESRWHDGWLATTESFRRLNTSAAWAEVAKKVRGPLGPTLSRTLLSQESVPAPPAGVEVVKFRTRFANKPEAIETVSLAREGGSWKVAGIYMD